MISKFKKLNKGVFRVNLTLSILTAWRVVYSNYHFFTNNTEGLDFFIVIVLYWLVLRIVLWIIDGFNNEKLNKWIYRDSIK